MQWHDVFETTKARQPAYSSKPLAYDEAEAKEHLQNAVIEACEAMVLFGKSWHLDKPKLDIGLFTEESIDIILFVFASCAWLGISHDDLLAAAKAKLAKNKTRAEHKPVE